MKNGRTYLKCDICGNIVGMIEDSGAKIHCCGQEMTLLSVNTVDVTKEKHVPSAHVSGNTMTVNIGSAPHPMTEDHRITWISVAQNNHTQRCCLSNTDKPFAEFTVAPGDTTVYAYCNLHGLWASEAVWDEPEGEITCSADFSDGCQSN